MPLTPGTRFAHYDIVSVVGSGGMGEVFRARDLRLNRFVAIKVLPGIAADDPDRVARFEREAQAVAALSHPNILAIHDFGRAPIEGGSEEITYAAMELLEGETVRQRLSSGPINPRKVIEQGVQIARGLAAAHDKGILHRDLKPENLFITTDGIVKILDFGLARRIETAAVAATGPTGRMLTEPGSILGTFGYMPPEQLRGEPVDARSDVFALGAVLYEMVTGRPAFARATAAETMTAIMRDDPPAIEEGRGVPAGLARVIAHCLEKGPEARFRSAHDLAFALEAVNPASSTGSIPAALVPVRGRGWRVPLGVVVAAVLLAVAFVAGRRLGAPNDAHQPPTFRQMTFDGADLEYARFAPDGKTIVYGSSRNGVSRVLMTAIDSRGSTRLQIPEAVLLAISPSAELALLLNPARGAGIGPRGTLAQAPLFGGAPRAVLEHVTFADWNRSGALVAVTSADDRQRLELVPGGALYETVGEIGWPRFSPSGDRIAFLDWPIRRDDRGTVAVLDVATKARRTISRAWEAVRGVAWHGDEVWFTAQEPGGQYDLYAATPDGRERVVYRAPGGLAIHDIAPNGRALLARYDRTIRPVALLEGDANERDLAVLADSFARDITPDLRTVVLSEAGPSSDSDYDVYLRVLDGSDPVHIGYGEAQQFSPDGKWVLSVRHGPPVQLVLIPTGPGTAQTVSTGSVSVTDARWLPDGRGLVLVGSEPGHRRRAYVGDTNGAQPRAISPEGISFSSNMLAVSPDGRHVALLAPDGRPMLYSTTGGDPVALPGLSPSEPPIGWADNASILVIAADNSGRVERVSISTGARDTWVTLRSTDMAARRGRPSLVLPPGRRAYLANYHETRTTMFVVEGLR